MEVTGLEDMMSPCTRETGNGCPASCLWKGLSGMGASPTVDWAMTVCFSTRVLATGELMPPVRTIITLFVKLKIKSTCEHQASSESTNKGNMKRHIQSVHEQSSILVIAVIIKQLRREV